MLIIQIARVVQIEDFLPRLPPGTIELVLTRVPMSDGATLKRDEN